MMPWLRQPRPALAGLGAATTDVSKGYTALYVLGGMFVGVIAGWVAARTGGSLGGDDNEYDGEANAAPGHTEMVFEYAAIPNGNEIKGGWLPMVWENGVARGDEWGRGYDRDEAVSMARENARDRASRFTGDWNITVRKRPGDHKDYHSAGEQRARRNARERERERGEEDMRRIRAGTYRPR